MLNGEDSDNNLPKFHKIMNNVEEFDFLEWSSDSNIDNEDHGFDYNEFRYNQRNGRILQKKPKSQLNSVISDIELHYDVAGNSYDLISSVPSIVINNSDEKLQSWNDFQVQSIPSSPTHSPCPGTSGESTIVNLPSTPQLSPSFTMRQEDQNSPTSSNHSYGEVPSPTNYQNPLNQCAQDQLEEGFDYLTNWAQTQDIKDLSTDNIDNAELQLVEEVLRDLSNVPNTIKKSIDRNDYCPDSFISDTYGYLFSDHPALPFRMDSQRFDVTSTATQNYDQGSTPGLIFNDFQIPKPVSSYENTFHRKCKRLISPWPSLNLPAIDASERLKESLNSEEVEKAMSNLLKRSNESLACADVDGDTMLMCLVGNPEELTKKRAYLVPLVERLSNIDGALSMTNNRGEDALYLVATNCPRMAYVTGYLAATMLEKGIDINQKLYHTRGDTLIHSVASKGDAYSEVLAELLAVKTVQGNSVFDLSIRNYDGRTALHVAVESHDPTKKRISSLAIVGLLIANGADPLTKEIKCGDTALHMAASSSYDPALIKVLIGKKSCEVVNVTNYNHDTPLHIAALGNNINIEKQKEVCLRLINAGAYSNVQNRQGKTPLALVSSDRREIIKRVFNTKLL